MNIYVMDANSLLASTRGEPGGHVAEDLLADPNADCIAHSVNFAKFFMTACVEAIYLRLNR